MTAWEYETVLWNGTWTSPLGVSVRYGEALTAMLGQKGREGWELVTVRELDHFGGPNSIQTVFIFKMPVE